MPCLIDRVSIFVTGAYSNVSSQTTSRQSHQSPAGAGPVPSLAPAPTDGLHRTARTGSCTASHPKTLYNASRCWRRFPARLFPHQIWDATLFSSCNFDATAIEPLCISGSSSARPFAKLFCPPMLARPLSMFILLHQLDQIAVRVVTEADAD